MRLEGKRLLIVDDDPDILEILEIIFESEGYEVILSETGEETKYLEVLKPDLILLDVRIVGSPLTGGAICTRIKSEAKTRSIPVILISAENDLPEIASRSRADGYVHKPFDIVQLKANVRKFLAA